MAGMLNLKNRFEARRPRRERKPVDDEDEINEKLHDFGDDGEEDDGEPPADEQADEQTPDDERQAAAGSDEEMPADEAGARDSAERGPDQAVYKSFVENGMRLIYDPKGMPAVIKSLDGDGNPVEGIATALATTVKRLEDSAAKAGQEIPPDVVAQGSIELLHLLAELGAESGVHEYTPEELKKAMQVAVSMHRDARGGPAQQQAPADEPAPSEGMLAGGPPSGGAPPPG